MPAQPAAHFAKLWSAVAIEPPLWEGGGIAPYSPLLMRAAISASINDRAKSHFPLSPKAVALPRALQSAPREIGIDKGALSTLFHVSHWIVQAVCCVSKGPPNREIAPFPQTSHPPSPHAQIFFGRVCYFLRKLTLKPAEKFARIVYENHVQNMWKRR